MANTPMVIVWPNSDGTVTISQRKAPAEQMPTVDSSPPRTATLDMAASSLSGTNPKISFTLPADSNSNDLIWAFSNQNPGSSAKDAVLTIHLNSGPTQIDLSKTLAADTKDPTNPVSTIAQTSSGNTTSPTAPMSFARPLLEYEKYIVAHGVMMVIGFLGLLPLGAIIARYLRTFSPFWFKLHWIIQWVLGAFGVPCVPCAELILILFLPPALPIIITGFALGVTAVNKMPGQHLDDTHKKWGVAIFVLYFFQLGLGAFIHFIKRPFAQIQRRSVQNYFHATFGIFLIGISFYQVRFLRYDERCPSLTELVRDAGAHRRSRGVAAVDRSRATPERRERLLDCMARRTFPPLLLSPLHRS